MITPFGERDICQRRSHLDYHCLNCLGSVDGNRKKQGRKSKSFAAAEVHALGNVEEYAVEEISESVEDQQGIVANDENMNEDEVTALRM